MNESIWQGCYDQRWGNNLVSAAKANGHINTEYTHPAKVSFKLAERIYVHTIENHWIEKGGFVLDPFGGICGFGFHAMVNGLNFIAVELEEKFVKLGEQNIELWQRQFAGWPNLGMARIIRGDSRYLLKYFQGSLWGRDLIISSPPYEDCNQEIKFKSDKKMEKFAKGQWAYKHGRSLKAIKKMVGNWGNSGSTEGNLGNSSGDTFWSASLEIIQQCYELLKPEGHAIWVCKDYIKNKKRVPFSQRWALLCESVGFKIVCWHKAMLVKEHGTQITMDGKDEIIKTERKSFFRRLAESKGSPRIDWEDVICMVKP